MSLHLIVGSMFSGKSSRLMQQVERYHLAALKVLVINHTFDADRSTTLQSGVAKETIRSHNFLHMPATIVSSLTHVFELKEYQEAVVIAIDEAQFYSDLYDSVRRMVDQDDKVVYVAGLDGTFDRKPFGQILDLVPLCDSIVKLHAVCRDCSGLSYTGNGSTATATAAAPSNGLFTKAIFHPLPGTTVSIGGADKYKSVCRYHYFKEETK